MINGVCRPAFKMTAITFAAPLITPGAMVKPDPPVQRHHRAILGLDPRTHGPCREKMDCRDKPGNDEGLGFGEPEYIRF